MTERLYYDNPYLKEFDATVLECLLKEDRFAVRLDRSAFYPTSGGQPFDTGSLGGAQVEDVYVAPDGEVIHVVDRPLTVGETVHGSIDWERRFDHMQQHAGEHMLANAAYRILGGMTIGLHLGAEDSSIDMTLPEGKTHATAEELRALEDDVNLRIQMDVPIRQWFPDAEELASLPLRKAPTVTEHIRIVQIGDLEFCACGGTHPSSAGQIGLVRIVDARPARGKLRLTFVCGKRAYELLRESHRLLHESADLLSTSVGNLPTLVSSLGQQVKDLTRKVSELQKQALLRDADAMLEETPADETGLRVVAKLLDADVTAVRELALKLAEHDNVAVTLGARSEKSVAYVVCRSSDAKVNAGAALSAAAKECGGKGGGKPDFAQGGGPEAMLDAIAARLRG